MRHAAVSLSLVAVLAAVAACQAPSSTGAKAPGETRAGTSGTKLGYDAGVVTGRVFAPAGVVASGGANVVAPGGANAVASGGANYRALAISEAMLAGAEVFIADAGGKPIPGLKHVVTDAQGRFSIPEVPAGYSFLVVARVKTAAGDAGALKTLARVSKLGTTVELGTASTLVATAAVEGRSDALGSYNVASFERAVQSAAKALGPDDVPDFADAGAVLEAFGRLEARVGDLESVVGQLKSDIARVEGELDAIKEQLTKNASPAPASARPSPAASASIAPSPSLSVSPTPSPTPSTVTGQAGAYVVSTLAGAGVKGFAEGVGTAAKFDGLRGLTLDASGNVYVADTNNYRVRKITPDGTVTTYAGQAAPGATDGALGVGKLSAPIDVAVLDAAGRLAVSDGGTQRIRLVAPDGALTTLAGGGGAAFVDGTGSAAKFRNPRGITFAGATLYVTDLVADSTDSRLRRVGLDGVVTTVADGAGSLVLADVTDVAVDSAGNMIVAQPTLNRVVRVTSAGAISVLAGTGTASALKAPTGVAVAQDGTIFIADTDNNRICRLAPNGTLTTIAGGAVGYADGRGDVARFTEPFDVEVDASGKVYVSEKSGQRVRVLTPESD